MSFKYFVNSKEKKYQDGIAEAKESKSAFFTYYQTQYYKYFKSLQYLRVRFIGDSKYFF